MNLRDRIANAISKSVEENPNGDVSDMADAVIRELDLDISHYYKTSQGREVCVEGFWTEEGTDGTA